MNQTKYIIKRIYSTCIQYPGQTFRNIPKCGECVFFSFQTQTCKKFACKSLVARANPFKCGFIGKYFIPKL